MNICDYPHCSNIATHYDLTHNLICEECMDRCVDEEGLEREDFEEI